MKKKSMELYTNKHPETTIHGTGFKDKESTKKTFKILKKYSLKKQYLVIHTLYYRAKYHPHQTKEMREAMKIYNKWLIEYKKKKKQKQK
jgi:hypothetical protein